MEKIGEAIRFFREKIYPGHGGQLKMATQVGIERASWCRYENQSKLTIAMIEKIAKWLGVSVEDILAKEAELAGKRRVDASIPPISVIHTNAPAVSATQPIQEASADCELTDAYDAQLPPGSMFVRVPGRAMEPYARDGQRVIVCKQATSPVNGDAVVIWTAERPARLLFRRFGVWAQDTLYVTPINQSEGGMELIARSAIRAVRVINGIYFN